MDINDWRAIVTVVSLICFVAIIAWAYSSRRRKEFEEAANLPFTDPDEEPEGLPRGGDRKGS